jgi:hypothetical protein
MLRMERLALFPNHLRKRYWVLEWQHWWRCGQFDAVAVIPDFGLIEKVDCLSPDKCRG